MTTPHQQPQASQGCPTGTLQAGGMLGWLMMMGSRRDLCRLGLMMLGYLFLLTGISPNTDHDCPMSRLYKTAMAQVALGCSPEGEQPRETMRTSALFCATYGASLASCITKKRHRAPLTPMAAANGVAWQLDVTGLTTLDRASVATSKRLAQAKTPSFLLLHRAPKLSPPAV